MRTEGDAWRQEYDFLRIQNKQNSNQSRSLIERQEFCFFEVASFGIRKVTENKFGN